MEETGAVRGVVLLPTRSCLCTPDGAGVARPLSIDNIAVNEIRCSAARRLAERLWLAVRQREATLVLFPKRAPSKKR